MILILFFSIYSKRISPKISYCFPEIIWLFWNEDVVPEDVEEMMSITSESLSNFSTVFLTDRNLSLFLDTDNFPIYYSNLPNREKACYIRICLPEKYGGLWIDTTVIVNSGHELSWVFYEAVVAKCEFISFDIFNKKLYFFSPSFFGCPLNSSFVKVYKKEYDVALSQDLETFTRNTCDNLNSRGLTLLICFPVYTIDYLFAKVMFENPAFRKSVILLPVERGPCRLHAECKENGKCVKSRVQKYEIVKKVPFVKYHSVFRNGRKLNRQTKSRIFAKWSLFVITFVSVFVGLLIYFSWKAMFRAHD